VIDQIDVKYAQLGGAAKLGQPVGARMQFFHDDPPPVKVQPTPHDQEHPNKPTKPGPDNGGQKKQLTGIFQRFQHGGIFQNLQSLSAVLEPISSKSSDWEPTGPAGWPVADTQTLLSADGLPVGALNRCAGGGIYYIENASKAITLQSTPLHAKWLEIGGPGGWLGFPLQAEESTPDGVGRFIHFQHGSIYWTPFTGAHEVHGLIRVLWASLGWEKNQSLGYPISDESPVSGTKDRFNDFENGVIYWTDGQPAAHVVQPISITVGDQKLPVPVTEVADRVTTIVSGSIASVKLPAQISGVHITGGPIFIGVTSYNDGATRVINRRHKFLLTIELVTPSPAPNIHAVVQFGIEVFLDRTKGNGVVLARVDQPTSTSEAGWPVSQANVDQANTAIVAAFNGISPKDFFDVPKGVPFMLSIKTMVDGAINVFVNVG
jgi:hypothetical protein